MNIFFSTAHLQTLKELQEMAEKHNCTIKFGFNNSSGKEIDFNILADCKVKKKIIDKLEQPFLHNFSIKNEFYEVSSIWFELYDKNKKTYNSLAYVEMYQFFDIEKDYDFDWEKEQLLDEFISESGEESELFDNNYHFRFRAAPTIINGFGYKNVHRDSRVYREGMALKFFSDLVCKYLKEPYIERVY